MKFYVDTYLVSCKNPVS